MADLGTIAMSEGSIADPRAILVTSYPKRLNHIRLPGQMEPSSERLNLGGKLDSDGDPLPPCLNMLEGGIIRFKFPVVAGTRSVSVKVREVSTFVTNRAKLRVLKNASLGIPATLEATAPVGTSWFTLGPLSFTAPTTGVVTVELEAFNGRNEHSDCRWDTLTVA